MALRIAVVLRDRCQPKKCSYECVRFCPRVRSGEKVVVPDERGKPVISEELCVGCGICVHKCPFGSVKIIGLPAELGQELVHQYGENSFRLFRLPAPRPGETLGLLGPNGIGKTTVLSILSGQLTPNLGDFRSPPGWDAVLRRFSGTELHDYLSKIRDRRLVAALKPQYVDRLPSVHDGRVGELLGSVDTEGALEGVARDLELEGCLGRRLSELSGGELQRVAVAATVLKPADVYFFDEPSSYLDIHQRLTVARLIRSLSSEKRVVVVEHDLAALDFLADNVYLMYGSEGAYGVVGQPRSVRNAINTYLNGYMREENIRFRDWPIRFEAKAPRGEWAGKTALEFPALSMKYDGFTLRTEAGGLREGEVVGVVGPNATGKTTFVRMLAGELAPSEGKVDLNLRVSYKPQYIKLDHEGSVGELMLSSLGGAVEDIFFKAEVERPLAIRGIWEKRVKELSGGELQRVALALCLGARDAELFLIDEPSAYLDSNQRMEAASTIRRVMEKSGRSAFIVDHDIYFLDLVSDSIMVFEGRPGVEGRGAGPFDMRTGMNRFLRGVGITFRRDSETMRPRINKLGSRLDREQKERGDYYYQN
ncbi:MAG: ribosome biogenesis/translation initiation ATPase RLI [Thermoplasmatota archaeon]